MNRGALTDTIITTLETHDLLVGDGVAPKEGGWESGQPNVGRFVPYVVVMAGSVQGVDRNIASGFTKDWMASYSLRTFSATRRTTDALAHAARTALEDCTPFVFGDDFKAIHVSISTIGSMQRNDASDPPLWQVFDSVEVHCVPHRT